MHISVHEGVSATPLDSVHSVSQSVSHGLALIEAPQCGKAAAAAKVSRRRCPPLTGISALFLLIRRKMERSIIVSVQNVGNSEKSTKNKKARLLGVNSVSSCQSPTYGTTSTPMSKINVEYSAKR